MARTRDLLPGNSPAGRAQLLVALHQQQGPHFERGNQSGSDQPLVSNILMKIASSFQFPRALPEIHPLAPSIEFEMPS